MRSWDLKVPLKNLTKKIMGEKKENKWNQWRNQSSIYRHTKQNSLNFLFLQLVIKYSEGGHQVHVWVLIQNTIWYTCEGINAVGFLCVDLHAYVFQTNVLYWI